MCLSGSCVTWLEVGRLCTGFQSRLSQIVCPHFSVAIVVCPTARGAQKKLAVFYTLCCFFCKYVICTLSCLHCKFRTTRREGPEVYFTLGPEVY